MWSHLCGQSLLHGHHETDNVAEMKSRWLKSFRYVRLYFQGMLRTRNRLWPIQIGAPSGFSFSDNPESSIWLEDNWHCLLPEPQSVGASGRSERQLSFSPSSARAPGASNWFQNTTSIVSEIISMASTRSDKWGSSQLNLFFVILLAFRESDTEKTWMVAVAFLKRKWIKSNEIIAIVSEPYDSSLITETKMKNDLRNHLTRKMMRGEMTSTTRSTTMPKACCWFAATSSLFTIALGSKMNKKVWFWSNRFVHALWTMNIIKKCKGLVDKNIYSSHSSHTKHSHYS